MDSHPLVEVAYVFHLIWFAIFNFEGWLDKVMGELCVLNVTKERWSRYLAQDPTHGITPPPQVTLGRRPIPSIGVPFSPYRVWGCPMNIALLASCSLFMVSLPSRARVCTWRWASVFPHIYPLMKLLMQLTNLHSKITHLLVPWGMPWQNRVAPTYMIRPDRWNP